MPTRKLTRSITQALTRKATEPGNGGGWSPLSLFASGEQGVWYDPSDFSTMFQDSAGTTPVTAVEQPVGKILDKSGRGNHASQSTAAARPVLSARKNLLRRTEDLTHADWTKTNASIATGVADPDGGTTAFTITANAANTEFYRQAANNMPVGSTISAWIRRRTGSGTVSLWVGNAFQTITVTGTWARISVTQAAATAAYFDIKLATSGDAVDVWHPQVEYATAATAYQRVTTDTDYDTVGFPHYLKFDGVDDKLTATFPDLGSNATIARSLPGVGASILTGQTIGAGAWNDSTNHCGLVIVNRALTGPETASLTTYLNELAGV